MRTPDLGILAIFLANILSCFSQITTPVSIEEALSVVKPTFFGQDVDYYLLRNDNKSVWTILVNKDPFAEIMWDCMTATVPTARNRDTSILSLVPEFEQYSLSSDDVYEPLYVKCRFNPYVDYTPKVPKKTDASQENPMCERTYALIISGGGVSHQNYIRYWNNCAFMYQTLVNTYGIPKDHIFPLMSDGNDPEEDTVIRTFYDKWNFSESFISQELDLDGDGEDDILLSASPQNISYTLDSLRDRMKDGDHLFIFVTDHGSINYDTGESQIVLWEERSFRPLTLATKLERFCKNGVNVNVVLGQCFSGGFINQLKKAGCVVATSVLSNEPSHATTDLQYSEFLYHWISAVNGANHINKPVIADFNGDGKVTMDEAFQYAVAQDRYANGSDTVYFDHPQYCSTPPSVGEDLSFTTSAPSIDLYIKDNAEDTGKQPNLTSEILWDSPSIRIRNAQDGGAEHENPIYSDDHTAVTVYVRVHNRGKRDYTGGQWAHLYWTQASTAIAQAAWRGQEAGANGATGGTLAPQKIEMIPAGEYRDLAFTWELPTHLIGTAADNDTERHHFCLLARVSDSPADNDYNGDLSIFNVRNDNDVAQKNVSIISNEELSKSTSVLIRNTGVNMTDYSLEIRPRTADDERIFTDASVELTMSPSLFKCWEMGAYESFETTQPVRSQPSTVRFLSKQSRINGLRMQPAQFDKASLKFRFIKSGMTPRSYTLDLIQRDADGKIVGGETFIVATPMLTIKPIDVIVTSDEENPAGLNMRADAPDFDSFTWRDGAGLVIGESESLSVVPNVDGVQYTVTALTREGELASADVNVGNPCGIANVCFEGTDMLRIELVSPAPQGAMLTISSASTGQTMMSIPLAEGLKYVTADVAGMRPDTYIVTYTVDAVTVDSKKINKQ